MDFYDIVMPSCAFENNFAQRLGFKRIFTCGKDIALANADKSGSFPDKDFVAIGANKNNLLAAARAGARAVVITDSRIDRTLMEELREQKTTLLMPISLVTSSYSLERPKRLYMISKLYSHAKKLGIEIGFATLAEARSNMCSYIQMVEIAKLIGADEHQARYGISEVNRAVVD